MPRTALVARRAPPSPPRCGRRSTLLTTACRFAPGRVRVACGRRCLARTWARLGQGARADRDAGRDGGCRTSAVRGDSGGSAGDGDRRRRRDARLERAADSQSVRWPRSFRTSSSARGVDAVADARAGVHAGSPGRSLAPTCSSAAFALAAFCFVLGLAFSAFMDVWNWMAFYDEHTWQTFVAVHARGLPFDLAHAIGNVLIALAVGPELRRLLDRYGRRLQRRSCGRSGPPDRCGRSPRRLRRTSRRVSRPMEASRRPAVALDTGAHRLGDARSSRRPGSRPETAYHYLVAHESELQSATDIELAVMAEAASGRSLGDVLYSRFTGSQPSGRPDRAGDQLDRLGNPRVRPGGEAVEGTRLVSPPAPAPVGRMGLDGGGCTGLERHGGCHPGAPHARRTRQADRARDRLSPSPTETPTAASSLRPGGVPTHSRRPGRSRRSSRARVKPPAGAFRYLAGLTAGGRQLSLLAQVRGDACVGDGTGAACARAEVVPAPLASCGGARAPFYEGLGETHTSSFRLPRRSSLATLERHSRRSQHHEAPRSAARPERRDAGRAAGAVASASSGRTAPGSRPSCASSPGSRSPTPERCDGCPPSSPSVICPRSAMRDPAEPLGAYLARRTGVTAAAADMDELAAAARRRAEACGTSRRRARPVPAAGRWRSRRPRGRSLRGGRA